MKLPEYGYFVRLKGLSLFVGVWFRGDFDGVREWEIETIGMDGV